MQMKDAQRLRRQWGDKPCAHPAFDKEYDLGGQTGDSICTQCGRDFTPNEITEIERNRQEHTKR